VLSPDLSALEQRWLEFLVVDCLDLLEYDFWLSPPEDFDNSEPIVFHPSDWNSGPCWDLAAALRLWLGPATAIDTIAIHGAARVGEWYLDGDGFSSPAQMRRRWARNAAAHGRSRTLAPLSEAYLRDALNPDMVLKLARRMRTRLSRDQFLTLLSPQIDALDL
jgi:hypothetical protein